ncbi:XRE family transcriptional regulator [Lentibacillus sp. N15]|uniref:helix-turn-helix domain-containing protein n=1 Tax=Lentibacillus songyuanensis TaxID=3136161 RepID=UPI0031BB9286
MNGFSRNLKKIRKERNLTMDELVEQINKKFNINFNKSMISKWENGYDASFTSVRYLTLFFGVSINELLGFDDDKKKKIIAQEEGKIPIMESISPKEPLLRKEHIISYAPAPPLLNVNEKGISKLFYMVISDDSMDREFPEGCLALIRTNEIVQDGDYAVVLIGSKDKVILTKVKIEEDILTLIPNSNNPKYLPQIINMVENDVQIIGKVIGSYRSNY